MEVKIKSIHFDATEKLEQFITKKVEKLVKHYEEIALVEVTLKVVKPETAMTLMAGELPLMAVRSQIASALDIMVHLGRLRDKSRKVLEIVEVGDFENGEIQLNPLFRFEEESDEGQKKRDGGRRREKVKGSLVKVGSLRSVEKLRQAGYPV